MKTLRINSKIDFTNAKQEETGLRVLVDGKETVLDYDTVMSIRLYRDGVTYEKIVSHFAGIRFNKQMKRLANKIVTITEHKPVCVPIYDMFGDEIKGKFEHTIVFIGHLSE